MRAVDLIRTKRDGGELDRAAIDWFVTGVTNGSLPDYQASALLMAIVLVGMTAEESRPLIQFLCNHATRPQFVYRHQWQKHDLLMWDNRCTLHIAVGDYDRTQLRYLEKTCVLGTPSGGYVYEGLVQ